MVHSAREAALLLAGRLGYWSGDGMDRLEELRRLIAEVRGIDPEQVPLDVPLRDLVRDSLDLIELTMAFEEVSVGVISDRDKEMPDLLGLTVGQLAAWLGERE
jgi:acyl carrier protein